MGDPLTSADCGWDAVDGFASLAEFQQIHRAITEQIAAGSVKETEVRKPYSGLQTLDEHWYQCKATGNTWRLIAPDPPFPGIFEKV
jgi:hypothetical protein